MWFILGCRFCGGAGEWRAGGVAWAGIIMYPINLDFNLRVNRKEKW